MSINGIAFAFVLICLALLNVVSGLACTLDCGIFVGDARAPGHATQLEQEACAAQY